MSIDVLTFGCRLNAYESEVIRQNAEAAGRSDIVVVNSCAVTAEAVRQARQAIRKLKRERPDAQVVVTGCAAQTEAQTFAAMPEVARVLGNDLKLERRSWTDMGAMLRRAQATQAAVSAAEKIQINDIMAVRKTAAPMIEGFEGRTRAFVQAQTGCGHRCTFCIIPYGRGGSRSAPMDGVVAQAAKLVANGYREVVLTGVDITSYGADLPGAPKLGTLVRNVLGRVPELARLRLSSLDLVEVDPELLDAIGSEARLMPHLHLSLQAGDDLILKRMKRRHVRADAIRFCDKVRQLRPDMAFGADLIAGFPTETEDMFARSLDLVDACGLTHLHVFPFSPRPGTPAARMPQVRREVVKERALRLREKADATLRAHLAAQVGARRRVLLETGSSGRTEQFTPVRTDAPVRPGEIRDLTVTGHDERALIAA